MKFNEKLQTLRKEKKLSQEQLAETLDVSRQAVSKWESGQSYPEMDKLLAICKIFKVTLDDLTNDEVKELKIESKTRNKINDLFDQITSFISRTMKMASEIDHKTLLRCITELIILFFILLILKRPFSYVDYLLDNIIKYLPYTIFHILSSTFYFIIMVVYWILSFIILFSYFDKRWLQKYENGELNVVDDNTDNTSKEIDDKPEQKVVINKTSSLGRLFNVLWQIVLICFKIGIFFTAIPFCALLVCACIGIVINIFIIFRGVFYFGPLICMICGVGLLSIIIELFFNFVFNRKTNLTKILIVFLANLIGVGIGGGIFATEIYTTHYYNEPVNIESKSFEYSYDMRNDLYINCDGRYTLKYVTDNSINNVKVKLNYPSDYMRVNIEKRDNTININELYESFNESLKYSDLILNDLKKRSLHNYANFYSYEIEVTASEKNIETIQANIIKVNSNVKEYDANVEKEIDSLTSSVEKKDAQIEKMQDQIDDLKEKVDKYESTLKDLISD